MNNPSAYEAAEWVEHAICAQFATDSMFPSEGDNQGIAVAKATCAICPVRYECLKSALERGEQWGIWGGMTPDERKTLRRKQQRGSRKITDLPLPGVA